MNLTHFLAKEVIRVYHKMLRKKPNDIFGQPNILGRTPERFALHWVSYQGLNDVSKSYY